MNVSFRSPLFPTILRGHRAQNPRDNALHDDRNERKNDAVPGKSNRDSYESKEKPRMLLRLWLRLNIKMDDHPVLKLSLQTLQLFILIYERVK